MPIAVAASIICQQAFRELELGDVASFGDDSAQATHAAAIYDTALAMVLEAHDWSFASTLADLPETTGTPAPADPDMPYRYALPGACLALREVGDGTALWRVDSDGLRADAPGPLRVRYTQRITNENTLPGHVKAAVSLQLAVLMAPQWLQVTSKADRLALRLDDAMMRAARTDARTASARLYRDGDEGGDWAAEATR